MPYIPEELVRKAKEIDLYTYLKNYEPGELVKASGNEYCTASHDSLKISNGKWIWWSHGIGGKSAVDYLTAVKNMSFYDAVETVLNCIDTVPLNPEYLSSDSKETKDKELEIPIRAPNNNQAISYLKSRGIAGNIIQHCIYNGYIFESQTMHNVVFMGFDKNREPKYAGLRGTFGKRFLGDAVGSDKRYTFRLTAEDNNCVHFFESAIDLLSYATLVQRKNINWRKMNLVALAGVYSSVNKEEEYALPLAMEQYLKDNPDTNKIYLHLDNDEAGRNAVRSIMKVLSERYEVIDLPPPDGKDVNDYLIIKNKIPAKSRKERNDAR